MDKGKRGIKNKDKLRLKWSKKENDLWCDFPLGMGTKSDCGLLFHFFNFVRWPENKTLIEELRDRGYDISTIKFSIEPNLPNERFKTLSEEYK